MMLMSPHANARSPAMLFWPSPPGAFWPGCWISPRLSLYSEEMSPWRSQLVCLDRRLSVEARPHTFWVCSCTS